MTLIDRDIRQLIVNGKMPDSEGQTAICGADESCVTNIGYDLRARGFAKDGKMLESCELNPGESAFVESKEIVGLDKFTIGRVVLKNSRLRMGFTMDAPTYQPGHKTRIYCRLTNITKNALQLNAGEKYVTIIFEQLDNAPEKPYAGTFKDEFDFRGLGDYQSAYISQIQSLDSKVKDLDALEKTIYGNVISVLAVFVAVFTLLNINITMAAASKTVFDFLIYNSSVVGCISALALLMNGMLNKKKAHWSLWLIPITCLVILVVIAFML